MKTRLKLKPKKKVVARPKKAIVPVDTAELPSQDIESLQLVHTDTQVLMEIAKPNLFRDEVQAKKVKFIKEIQQLSSKCGLEAELRVYFTFKLKE